jgi:hypothetical protein
MEFLHRAVRLTLLISGIGVPLAVVVVGVPFALGLLGGVVWSLANLWVLKALMVRTISPPPGSRRWQNAMLFVVKFPLLYAVGGWLLLSSWGSPVGFVIGFSLWQACLVLSASVRAISS